ncbi:hypothetical protein FOMPIDRAFT_1051838 [Fomitopsis schrenkii]|uniref:PPPDE domain-containing protein n=1 Tax=Fomitopsis schrenkii TaxID=2126942 RepID=S8DZW5_FOMSC|nr:hypothetical protein FOMPIDRAFT_1051838 [Fomitopsis schrenkii]
MVLEAALLSLRSETGGDPAHLGSKRPKRIYILGLGAGVYVVQYYAKDAPHHWAIFVEKDTDKEEGAIFDINGNTTNYVYRHKGKVSMKRSNTYEGRVAVGSMLGTDKRDGEVDKLLKNIPIQFHNDPNWNCQNWVVEALAKMEQKGYLELDREPDHVPKYPTGAEIAAALKKVERVDL